MTISKASTTLEVPESLDPCERCGNGSTRSYFRVRFPFGIFDFCRHHFIEVEEAARNQGAEIIDLSEDLKN